MTLLTTVQNFSRRTGLAVPTTVYGSSDPQVLQVLAILEEEGNDLSGRGRWQELTREATHTTLAQEDQGAIDTIAATGFRYILPNTFWDRTESLPVLTANEQEWQGIKGFNVTGPRYRTRLRGGKLLSNPSPPAGNTWAFEYVSWHWIVDTGGSTYKQYFTADDDEILLPEPVILQGLRWRWKKEKGLDYEEDFNTYEAMVKDAIGREGIQRTLMMDERTREPAPGVIVTQGNWNL